jgi:hypothetical protein
LTPPAARRHARRSWLFRSTYIDFSISSAPHLPHHRDETATRSIPGTRRDDAPRSGSCATNPNLAALLDGPWLRNYWEGNQDCSGGRDWVVQSGDTADMYALRLGCFPQAWTNDLNAHCQSFNLPPGKCAVWDQNNIMSSFNTRRPTRRRADASVPRPRWTTRLPRGTASPRLRSTSVGVRTIREGNSVRQLTASAMAVPLCLSSEFCWLP